MDQGITKFVGKCVCILYFTTWCWFDSIIIDVSGGNADTKQCINCLIHALKAICLLTALQVKSNIRHKITTKFPENNTRKYWLWLSNYKCFLNFHPKHSANYLVFPVTSCREIQYADLTRAKLLLNYGYGFQNNR